MAAQTTVLKAVYVTATPRIERPRASRHQSISFSITAAFASLFQDNDLQQHRVVRSFYNCDPQPIHGVFRHVEAKDAFLPTIGDVLR